MDIRPIREGPDGSHEIPRILPLLNDRHRRRSQARYDPHELPSYKLNFHVLEDFVQRSQPWSQQRVPLPRRLRWAFWMLIPVELFWAIWLATIVTGSTACRGPICTVATLDHHAAALLACGVFCVAVLAGLIPSTRGFSRCNGIEVTGFAIAATAGAASLLGVVTLIISALIGLIVLATFVLAFHRDV
jgi:hypothetical protein